MLMKLAADRIAKKLSPGADYEAIRDACDTLTDSELDCTQLDILASMVVERVKGLIETY